MMRYKIIFEETVCQDFEVEAADPEEALKIAGQKYKNCEFVLEPGDLMDVQFHLAEEEVCLSSKVSGQNL